MPTYRRDAAGRPAIDQVEKLIDSMFARAMANGEPTEDQYPIAQTHVAGRTCSRGLPDESPGYRRRASGWTGRAAAIGDQDSA